MDIIELTTTPNPSMNLGCVGIDSNVKVVQTKNNHTGFILFIPHYKFFLRWIRKKVKYIGNTIKLKAMPFSPTLASIIVFIPSISATMTSHPQCTFYSKLIHFVSKTGQYIGDKCSLSYFISDKSIFITPSLCEKTSQFIGTFIGTSTIMFTVAAVLRFITRQLFKYNGWMYDDTKNPSTTTKIWGFIMKYILIRGVNNSTFGLQSCLPSLPLPDLFETVTKYIESVKGFADESECAETISDATKFLTNEGPKLQRYLKLKWFTSSNYISDWWLKYAYLYGRDPLIINSNWYGVAPVSLKPSPNMASRAAEVTYELAQLQKDIAENKFKSLILRGIVPLCMDQYRYAFATNRIPGVEHDNMVTYEYTESRYIIVLYQGALYKVQLYSPHSNNQLTPQQLYGSFKGILDAHDGKSIPVTDQQKQHIAALTTMNRTEWANARNKHLLECSYNNKLIETIDKAAFCLTFLDDSPNSLSEQGKTYLTGNGSSFWVDKCINLVIDKTTHFGIHVEHSWADALIGAHFMEHLVNAVANNHHSDDNGILKLHEADIIKNKSNHLKSYPAEQIMFQMNTELNDLIEKSKNDHIKQADNIDYEVAEWHNYGKSISKLAKCSPDAWVQMALQLAYFRDQGLFVQTYESSMTRLFKYGRTETIRSASVPSREFVLAMENQEKNKGDKLYLLQEACKHHQSLTHDAMLGKGIDRHLFALYIISIGKNIPSDMLKKAFARKWKLSTSQTPNNQSGFWKEPCAKKDMTPNGGFGPTAVDGYGVSYVMYQEHIYFNISSKFEAANTSSSKFGMEITKALSDMKALLQ